MKDRTRVHHEKTSVHRDGVKGRSGGSEHGCRVLISWKFTVEMEATETIRNKPSLHVFEIRVLL